jgi:hypothetical protein
MSSAQSASSPRSCRGSVTTALQRLLRDRGRSVFELVREKGWLDDEELTRLLAPEAMTDPRRPSEWPVMPVGIPPLRRHVEPAVVLGAVAD